MAGRCARYGELEPATIARQAHQAEAGKKLTWIARMARSGADNGVVSALRESAWIPLPRDTNEGIASMGKHRRTSHVARYVQAVQANGLIKAPQNVSLGRATGGVVALALVLGGIGAEAAAASTHGGDDHVNAGQPVGSGRIGTSHSLASPDVVSQRPWMY